MATLLLLDYALEKLAFSITIQREVCLEFSANPDVLQAFEYSVKTYLILTNMLIVWNEGKVCDHLLKMDYKQFSKWLEWVKVEGCMIEEDPPTAITDADLP